MQIPQWLVFTSHFAAILFEVVLITLLLLLFGEIMPKIFSTQHPLRFAKAIAFPLYALHQILKPLSYLLVTSTQIVHKRIGKK
jgi:CBS domain containing-hemolysin-like protein